MSKNGVSHQWGTCDNCGAEGILGWVVGMPDKSHKHSCKSERCKEALETASRRQE